MLKLIYFQVNINAMIFSRIFPYNTCTFNTLVCRFSPCNVLKNYGIINVTPPSSVSILRVFSTAKLLSPTTLPPLLISLLDDSSSYKPDLSKNPRTKITSWLDGLYGGAFNEALNSLSLALSVPLLLIHNGQSLSLWINQPHQKQKFGNRSYLNDTHDFSPLSRVITLP